MGNRLRAKDGEALIVKDVPNRVENVLSRQEKASRASYTNKCYFARLAFIMTIPLTCIIGESDPFIAQLLERFAEESGLRVMRATFSQEVLPLLSQAGPAVIVMDADLPGELRGWEVIRRLRAEPEFKSLPVISCSWMSRHKASTLMGKLAGHLKKPDLHYADFLSALHSAGVQFETGTGKDNHSHSYNKNLEYRHGKRKNDSAGQ